MWLKVCYYLRAMRHLLTFLLVTLCGASISGPAGATLLAYVPSQTQEAPAGPEFEADALERELYGLEERLLSSQAASALTVSELRTRALAQGVGAPDSRVRPQVPTQRQGAGPVAAVDPLALALSQFVSAQAAAAPGPAGKPAELEVQAPAFHDGRGANLVVQDEELVARIADIRGQIADAVLWAVSPELAADGRVGFSVLGLSGFRARSSDTGTTVMLGDVSLLAGERATRHADGAPAARYPGDMGADDIEGRNAMLRLLILVWDIVSHPISIGLLILVTVVRLMLGLGARRAAF